MGDSLPKDAVMVPSIIIDCGRSGCEGGGQMLRSGLVLASIAGNSIRFDNIRQGRSVPGLRPQHLAVIRTFAELTGGLIIGEIEVGTKSFTFIPGDSKSILSKMNYEVDIGSAGSITLLLQALLPIIVIYAKNQIRLVLRGGTDVSNSPPMDFFQEVLCGYLRRMNIYVKTKIIHRGFYPRGGGKVEIIVTPPTSIRGLTIENHDNLNGVVHLNAILPRCFFPKYDESIRNDLSPPPHKLAQQMFFYSLPTINFTPLEKEHNSNVFAKIHTSTSQYQHGPKVKAVTYSLHAIIRESEDSIHPIRNMNWICTKVNAKGDGATDLSGNSLDVIRSARKLAQTILFDDSGCVDEYSADQLLVFAVIAATCGESSLFSCRKEMSSLHFITMVNMIREIVPDIHLGLEEDDDLYRVSITP